jgi:tripartite-type tricarboxylate transporter receptor subunit TctC
MARAPVSKTGGWGFESLHSCQAEFQAEVPHQHPEETPRQLSRRRLIRLTAAAAGLTLLPSVAERQAFSQAPKTIRFIVPFPPGGGADLLMRVLAEQIGRGAGVATVVENRPGAASIVGTEFVSRAAPDGGTVLIAANSFIIHPFFKKLNYDPLTSFAPIAWLATSPQVIVVNAASPFHTLADLVETARAKPGQLTNASVGPATTQHIAFELFKLRAKIKMIYVPFNGNGPAVNELLGGHVDSVMANYAEAAENIKAGNLRALAVGSPARLEWMPEVPTIAESGYPGYEVSVWYGLFTPTDTPAAVIEQLGQWCSAAMLAPELKPKWALQGLEPVGKPAAELAAHLRKQREEYGRVIREADIQAE